MPNSIRTGNYQISYDAYFARIRRLTDMRSVDLYGSDAALMKRNVETLIWNDSDHLGSKPSHWLCKAIDTMCQGYY